MSRDADFVARVTAVAIAVVAVNCGPHQSGGAARGSPGPTTAAPGSTAAGAAQRDSADPYAAATDMRAPEPMDDEIRRVSLSGDVPVPVPRSDLTVRISGTSHKIRAPVIGVSILVEEARKPAARKAEVGWRIESGQLSPEWREVAGRRFDNESSSYLEEHIPGWLVKLDSIDDQAAGGSPTAITVSFKRAPRVPPHPVERGPLPQPGRP